MVAIKTFVLSGILGLATAVPPLRTLISVDIEEPSRTSHSVPGAFTSASSIASATNTPVPDFDFETKTLFQLIKRNLKGRKKATNCNKIEDDGLFANKTAAFLNQWRTITGVPGETGQSFKQIIERLVVYQSVYKTVREESRHNAFPDNVIDQIRSIDTFVQESGALTAADPRIIEALDIIFHDVCADTGET
ncbi:hypothetical protein PG996_016083 [Apiospora saccharicola]|uniref:RxLR effector protein n=1 Tax=Apiospora saccharicola TaxID=335842 RepID=A0ABR1TQK7_9PEZI